MMKEEPSNCKPPQKNRNSISCKKTLGPVSNLEEYLEPDWWQNIFNSIYLKTDGDIVEDKQITKKEVDLFTEIISLSPEDKILDLCCGQGRHCIELANRGFKHVEGLDRSHYLIQKAKKEGLKIKLREGDARKLPYSPDTFDVIMILGNSFGYFETVKEDMIILKEVFRVLKPWGRFLIDAADGNYLKENFKPRSWEWIDKKYFVCRERSLSLDKTRLISREIVSNVNKGVIADQFYAERLYTQEELIELLKQTEFSNISSHGTITTDSKRNQDLGMTERRIIISAIVKKDWSPIKIKKTHLKNVVVLLGDPNKIDILKPLYMFDDDDLYTIDRLISSLREIEKNYNYKFHYFTNHDTMVKDLIKTQEKGKIDFVFNLCDEGYFNDARKELHLPALLDILGIPYTGSEPQCLAYCYDKSLIRGIAKEMGVPIPQAFFIKPEDAIFEIPFDFPVIVKPNFGDSSFGITHRSVVCSIEKILNVISEIRDKFGYDKPILIEEFLSGKDLSVGIIGNFPDSYTVLPIIEEDYSELPPTLPKICGYEAKWLSDSPYWSIKSIAAKLPEDIEKFIIDFSLKLFERLECRDYTRFDWRLKSEEEPKLLEVNPNPGWCWDGHLAKMAEIKGISYIKMLLMILKSAEKRFKSAEKYSR
ncbi:MAG: methyltransferase domain-containing protein [Actinobacteria bacterium]|nr:methyltransferase domain-containing protein [Actinomycetota bacterium]MBL7124285.1 methyltransferase domain-containing protein [Actinomycetota bacterium]